MKQLLRKLKEAIEISDNLIQFKIGNEFYELNKINKTDWQLFTVFGRNLPLNTKRLKGLEKEEVEEVLKTKYPNIEIY